MPAQSAASMNTFIQINGKVIQSTTSGFIPQLLVLTQNPILPTNTVQQFSTSNAVSAYFGNTTNSSDTNGYYIDSNNAAAYFAASPNKGYGNPPSSILFYRYVASNTAAFTRGSALSVTTNLATLKLVTAGTLVMSFNGTTYTATGINLSSDNSFSAMATTIQTAVDAQIAGTTVTFDTTTNAFTITFPYTGANTVNYVVNSGSGSTDQLAQRMLITQASGAVISQGMAAQTPAQVMTAVTNLTNNFATFVCNFEINTDPTYAIVIGLTAWVVAQAYFYLPLFYDYLGGASEPITAPMETAIINAGYGQMSVNPWTITANIMTMITNTNNITMPFSVAGVAASYNFNAPNGIIQLNATTFAVGTPVITNNADVSLLLDTFNSNSYINLNTRANNFQWFQKGSIGGNYGWIDTYIGYMWLADQCQVQIAGLMQNLNSIPYNNLSIINAVLEPIFVQGLGSGVVQTNIPLSASQIAALIAQAGYNFSPVLYNAGYFVPPITATATDIANRTLSNVAAWYTYAGGPVYVTVNLTTVE